MRKYIVSLLVVVVAGCLLTGCSGSGASSASADTVDASSKVLASNATLDNSKTKLSATNVQAAIEEIAPSELTSSTFMGTWNVTNFNNGANGSTGVITFNSDGTFQVSSGQVIAISADINYSGTWQIVKNMVIEVQENGTPDKFYLYPLSTSSTKIVMIRASNLTVFEKPL